MLILSKEEIQHALPMKQAIEATKAAYVALSSGKAVVPQRIHLLIPQHEGMSLFMPAYLQYDSQEALAVKTVSVFPHNAEQELPIIHGAVLVLDAETGRAVALLEGGSLTAIRTGAASGAATDILSRPDSQIVAIFGAGIQGRTQLEAICTVRSIEKVFVYDPQPDMVREFITEMAGSGSIPGNIQPAQSPQQAIAAADVICCATTSKSPVFQDKHLKPGVHINGVGSFTPEMQEIPAQSIARSALFVDSRPAALHEAGDIILPIKEGLISESHIQAEIGEILLGEHPGRVDSEQITFFKSVGVAVQDAAAAHLALINATRLGFGQEVTL